MNKVKVKGLELASRPKNYFTNKKLNPDNKDYLTIICISFNDPMNIEEFVEISINVKKKNKEFKYFVSDNLDPKNGYSYKLKETITSDTMSYSEIITLIIEKIKDPDDRNNIIYQEWDFQYYEKGEYNIVIESDCYPLLNEYFQKLIQEYNKNLNLKIKESQKYDKIINDHINKSNIDEIISVLIKKKFGRYGIQPLNQDVFKYVKKYFMEKKSLPTGPHKINSYTINFKK